jgi:hypothetical protein
VVDQRWLDGSSGAATDRFQYGYDRDGNRLYRDNAVSAASGEVYAYDGLGQVARSPGERFPRRLEPDGIPDLCRDVLRKRSQ